MRYAQLDGLRGLLLISMAISHIAWALPNVLSSLLVVKHYSIAEVASGFVFVSGLVVALAYGPKYLDGRAKRADHALKRRFWTIYLYHAGLVLIATGLAIWTASRGQTLWIFQAYGEAPALFGGLSLLTLVGGWSIDILPIYLLCMLVTPAALAAMARGNHATVAVFSIATWAIAQSGLVDLALMQLDHVLGLAEHGIALGLYFSRLSWQLLYFAGLLLGMLFVQGKITLKTLRHPRFYPVFVGCIAFCMLCCVLAVIRDTELPAAVGDRLRLLSDKPTLGILSVLNFAAMVFAFLWLSAVKAEAPNRWTSALAWGLDQILRWQPLTYLGQHALQVFAFQILQSYLFYTFVDSAHFGILASELVVVLSILLLYLPAWLHARHVSIRKASTRNESRRGKPLQV